MIYNSVDVSELKLGKYKNYKALCGVLNEPIKGGKSKTLQLENWKRFFSYYRMGSSYIITEIKKNPDKKINNTGTTCKDYNNLLMSNDFSIMNHGVYSIEWLNNIYVGSTTSSFRIRFQTHNQKSHNEKVNKMIENGGVFRVLWCAEKGFDDEETVRRIEQLYIDYYRNNSDYILVNEKDEVSNRGSLKDSKNIKVKGEDYEIAISILMKNGIEVLSHLKTLR